MLVSVSENLWGGKIQLVLSLVIAAFELLIFWKCYPLEMKESWGDVDTDLYVFLSIICSTICGIFTC